VAILGAVRQRQAEADHRAHYEVARDCSDTAIRRALLAPLQRCEPLDIEAFVAESAVETLDEPVLDRPSGAGELAKEQPI